MWRESEPNQNTLGAGFLDPARKDTELAQMHDLFLLDDRVVIITGGAGMLGAEYARAVALAGGRPVIADVSAEAAERVASGIEAECGRAPFCSHVDVANRASVLAMVDRVLDRHGRIDGLVNNAALDPKFDAQHAAEHTQAFEQYPLEAWNLALGVNLTGMFLCAQAVAPAMLAQGKGVIVNISSTYGLVGPDQRLYETGDPGSPTAFKPVTYSVTKAGVLGLTRYLATYWAGKGIRVNSLTPGGVYNEHDTGFVRRYSYRTPLGRMAEREEYNGSLLYLLSDASSYMTGANLVVDGGWTAW